MSLRSVVAVAELVGADELAEPPSVEPRRGRTVPPGEELEQKLFHRRGPEIARNMAVALTESSGGRGSVDPSRRSPFDVKTVATARGAMNSSWVSATCFEM